MSTTTKKNILRVDGNKDKGNTYKKLHERYKYAYDSGFYLEAMVIVYAMIEDRFNAILCALKIADYGEKSLVVINGLEKDLYDLLHPNSEGNGEIKEFVTISGKYKVLRKFLSESAPCPEGLLVRKEIAIVADKNRSIRSKTGKESKRIRKIINEIETWNYLRNQYIHAIFNKRFDASMGELPSFDKQGLDLARELDNFCERVKTQTRSNSNL